MKREIECPHCHDKWTYKYIIDNEHSKVVVTEDYHFINEWEECTCYKCGGKYRLMLDKEPDIKMFGFIYNIWRKCKGK